MSDARDQLAIRGERLAEQALRRRGLKPVTRRYRTPFGELDLVMRDRATVVFVEVKTQRDRRLIEPHERVGAAKQSRLAKAAHAFLHARRWTDRACRFDVVSVILPENGDPQIEHFPDAFVPRRSP